MPSFHVLIAGGGIGGLCLAQGLRRAGISCTVYESAPGIGRAGYRLHMNGAGGRALQQCLPDHLFELYMQTSRETPRREVMVLLDHQARELGARPHIGPPNDPSRPHTAVNRRTLRQILSLGLEDIVRYGSTVTGYETDGDKVRVLLDDGTSATGDVLVGADGINSVVRGRLLPEVPVVDTGMRSLYSTAPLTDELAASLPEALFDGFAVATGPNGALFAYGVYRPRRPVAEAVAELMPGAAVDPVDPYIMVNLGLPPGSPVAAGAPDLWNSSAETLHALMRTAVRGWDPALAELVEHVDPATIFPVSTRHLQPADPWPAGRVTLLGDAIHAMPPSFGSGANTALRDAAALARGLERAAHGDIPVAEAVAEYENEMRAEVFPILRASADPRAADVDFLPDDLPVSRT
ncbi:FAD-dependent monooxygenase [Streptomyces sp. BK205]|uniref:FAD-dependent oxidoreductase n=1 Tax=Streptomyces sp. BK205 TaxID=2512164 RepID=UPI001048395C|nr:FAD-dependent monooxygenase [Streptomyces sp. BK205]TCR16833.1 2-polyprenyl-6-methoxyphenol hydroxylase-like FAD-dependent oxidoreductase [Streptomyces sp. BK205]